MLRDQPLQDQRQHICRDTLYPFLGLVGATRAGNAPGLNSRLWRELLIRWPAQALQRHERCAAYHRCADGTSDRQGTGRWHGTALRWSCCKRASTATQSHYGSAMSPSKRRRPTYTPITQGSSPGKAQAIRAWQANRKRRSQATALRACFL